MCELIPACCDDNDDYDSAITPILSTKEPIDSLSMGDEHLDTVPATESDEVIKSSVEDLIPIPSESEGIPDTMCDMHFVNNPTPLEAKDHVEIVINSNDDISSSDDDSLHEENIEYVEASPHDSEVVSLEVAEIVTLEVEVIEDDNLREKLLNVRLLIANIEALKDNPTQSSELLTKSSSTSLNSFLEDTNTFHNSLPEFENLYFDLGEISSGKISSGSTTTHYDISLSEYDSFIFDFAHEEFVDELAHIISPQEYDRFCFWNLPDPGELMSVLNFEIRENLPSATSVNLPIEDDQSPLLAYVVWIFVAYLTYLVIPPYLHPFGNEDTIFDPGITINHFYSFKPGSSHQHRAFKKFNTHRSHWNEWPMIINGKNTPLLDVRLVPGNLKTLAKGFYPPSLNFLSFNWESLRRYDFYCLLSSKVKENQEKDKIGSKPDKNRKHVEVEKSLKQLQWVKEEKLNKTQKEWPETQAQSKAIQVIKEGRSSGHSNSWYQSKLGKHLRRRQHFDFIPRELRREKEARIGSRIKKISKDFKEMLKKKMEEIMLYNSTISHPHSDNNSQNKYKRYKCFHYSQRGHILKTCPMNDKNKDKVTEINTKDGETRRNKYSELSSAEAIQSDCDVKATNIILQALPLEIYALVSTHKVAKDLWEQIQMLMQGTSLTKQKRECKLYDAFDKFAYQKGET
nr:ARID DNA-binding domain-containing protein [Tanacetum cinerariifolium]